MKLKLTIILTLLLCGTSSVIGQVIEPPEWEITFSKIPSKIGEKVTIHFEAEIPDGWYMYSSDFDPEVGPLITEFSFHEDDQYELLDEIQLSGAKAKI
ncbi:hypothetical protein LZ575_11300 [Antarcticibacterium sp. 1MA-6-2]|uniref:hypothetical protein n=1 Tax=Antarcticibacterium sp. 1MA-6-2 TaxID=2908210 RepID=UPI001F3DAE2D|nr:hypothetical protein [Antarcticibacterium sp. 1MA-6-2]UJH89670.1 hypothetical protein LZ575_11300 [Antarcticibacterium sp. 1MA-6-2]